ncbi:SLAP domain-containing protein [Ureibacillus chungkukjangi]|uniref:SLAP domain-containing protein n=1 Tax=Ureibacillus chungkukjangi TaxID=1202712 RepID=UPI00203CC098|nr:SLAP domain-containing protein [Ureibacillus chungkukjangi]MCM3388347.1 SLAP domain-containing protein [Ureibacillus chungkukjangi]
MQQLLFEASWEKALAPNDRQNIERIFHETKSLNHSAHYCAPIREAINHKEALLVTVLVHNFMDYPLIFENTRLLYRIQGKTIAEEIFNLPALTIPPKASMPWTFIFPKGSYKQELTYKYGELEILNSERADLFY